MERSTTQKMGQDSTCDEESRSERMPMTQEEPVEVVFKDNKMFIKTADGQWYEVKSYL